MFSSDMQRRAAFANMFSRGFTTNGVVAVAGPKVCVEPKLLVGVDKKALKFIGKFSIGDLNRRVDIIEGLLKSKNLNDFQKDKLRKEKMELDIELGSDFSDDPAKRDEVLTDKQKKLFIRMHDQYSNEMSKHPMELGSVWVGNGSRWVSV